MRKFFVGLLILTLFLSGCGTNIKNNNANLNKHNKTVSENVKTNKNLNTNKNSYITQNSNIVTAKNLNAPHISTNIPQFITYNGDHVSVWVNQLLFVENGDLKESYDGNKSYIKLNYAKDNVIKTIDLTSYALKYDLFNGIDYITASPSGKYIVLEFSQDVPISVIVDTDTNKSNILWYDESKKESMMRISFNPNNEDEFAFLPSAEINGPNGSHSLKLYEIKTHNINTVGEISEKDITMQNSMIQWGKNTINIISLDKNKIFNFNYYKS
ncbi:hypothetical protein [Thermoanaerobacterium thermosaccharolyticum]|uniref:hypothetical protein n=1 Tax=Thermoanaerobacterium thermosaccharolyticum TaxID=1517 RepID=UPI002FDA32C8